MEVIIKDTNIETENPISLKEITKIEDILLKDTINLENIQLETNIKINLEDNNQEEISLDHTEKENELDEENNLLENTESDRENNQQVALRDISNKITLMEENTQLIQSMNLFPEFYKTLKFLLDNAPDLINYPDAKPNWDKIVEIVADTMIDMQYVNKELDLFLKTYLAMGSHLESFHINSLKRQESIDQIIKAYGKNFMISAKNLETTLVFLNHQWDLEKIALLKQNFKDLIQKVSKEAITNLVKDIESLRNKATSIHLEIEDKEKNYQEEQFLNNQIAALQGTIVKETKNLEYAQADFQTLSLTLVVCKTKLTLLENEKEKEVKNFKLNSENKIIEFEKSKTTIEGTYKIDLMALATNKAKNEELLRLKSSQLTDKLSNVKKQEIRTTTTSGYHYWYWWRHNDYTSTTVRHEDLESDAIKGAICTVEKEVYALGSNYKSDVDRLVLIRNNDITRIDAEITRIRSIGNNNAEEMYTNLKKSYEIEREKNEKEIAEKKTQIAGSEEIITYSKNKIINLEENFKILNDSRKDQIRSKKEEIMKIFNEIEIKETQKNKILEECGLSNSAHASNFVESIVNFSLALQDNFSKLGQGGSYVKTLKETVDNTISNIEILPYSFDKNEIVNFLDFNFKVELNKRNISPIIKAVLEKAFELGYFPSELLIKWMSEIDGFAGNSDEENTPLPKTYIETMKTIGLTDNQQRALFGNLTILLKTYQDIDEVVENIKNKNLKEKFNVLVEDGEISCQMIIEWADSYEKMKKKRIDEEKALYQIYVPHSFKELMKSLQLENPLQIQTAFNLLKNICNEFSEEMRRCKLNNYILDLKKVLFMENFEEGRDKIKELKD